jgi:DnaJ-domain-containing protein 1
MEFGTTYIGPVGARFGEHPPDDLVSLFPSPPPDDDELGPFGPLEVLTGWMGHAGPGLVLRTRLRAAFDPRVHAVELRLRSKGRYVRSLVAGYGDRHGDLTLPVPVGPWIHAFLPYAALSPRHTALSVEGWLVEDGEPVEEALWPLDLPDHETRRLENALTAVVLALMSVTSARGDSGVIRTGAVEDAVGELFELDRTGQAWAREIVADAEAESERMTVTRLLAYVGRPALPRVLALLERFVQTPRARRFVEGVVEGCGAEPAPPPRVSKADAAHYRALGLPPGATDDEVRAAFRRAAALHHPDRAPEAERAAATETMKQLNAAYAALRKR